MGISPKIVVDLFDGYINVVQSTDETVSAVIKRFAVAKNSQVAADAALGDILDDLNAYCLMPNHFHLALWPHEDDDLSRWKQGAKP